MPRRENLERRCGFNTTQELPRRSMLANNFRRETEIFLRLPRRDRYRRQRLTQQPQRSRSAASINRSRISAWRDSVSTFVPSSSVT